MSGTPPIRFPWLLDDDSTHVRTQRAVLLHAGGASPSLGELAPDGLEDISPWVSLHRLLPAYFSVQRELHGPTLGSSAALTSLAVSQLAIQQQAISVSEILGSAGLDHRFIKGLAAAATIYESAMDRQTGDVDLLVPQGEFQPAANALLRAGLREISPPARSPAFEAARRTRVFDADGWEIDLHARVQGRNRRYILPQRCYFDEVPAAGHRLRYPSPELIFVHALLHLTSADTRLSSAADVIRLSTRVNADRVADLLARATLTGLANEVLLGISTLLSAEPALSHMTGPRRRDPILGLSYRWHSLTTVLNLVHAPDRSTRMAMLREFVR